MSHPIEPTEYDAYKYYTGLDQLYFKSDQVFTSIIAPPKKQCINIEVENYQFDKLSLTHRGVTVTMPLETWFKLAVPSVVTSGE